MRILPAAALKMHPASPSRMALEIDCGTQLSSARFDSAKPRTVRLASLFWDPTKRSSTLMSRQRPLIRPLTPRDGLLLHLTSCCANSFQHSVALRGVLLLRFDTPTNGVLHFNTLSRAQEASQAFIFSGNLSRAEGILPGPDPETISPSRTALYKACGVRPSSARLGSEQSRYDSAGLFISGSLRVLRGAL